MRHTCRQPLWQPHETPAGAPLAVDRLKNEQLVQALDLAQRSGPVRDIVIPPCPELLVQLQDATATAEPDLEAIARIASADVAMSAALLRQANSPLFGLQQPVVTVGQALNVLGMRPAVKLLSGFLTRHALQVHSPLLAHFWETSMRRAIACEHIGQQLYGMDPGLSYTFGLFCHVGMPVMMAGVKGYGGTLTEAMARMDRSFTQTENANHRTDHAVVGAIVARTWRLPLDVALAIRLHHDFTCLKDAGLGQTQRRLVAMGLIADHLVHQHEQLPPLREWQQHGAACLGFLEVSEDEVNHWIDELHPAFEAVELA